MAVRSEDFDRKVILRLATPGTRSGGLNEYVPGPVTEITVPASKRDVSDSERVSAQEVGAEITTRFQVRWSSLVNTSTVNAKDSVELDGLRYEIVAVKEIGRREGVEISAVARTDQ
ncbi:hypothetical protein IZ6_07740 [Terrihabitans soli]|uniref:Head-tail adaptor protein n=1 Tax=Terrihabitans soli TaxID=708113 RepID=A0A6S6QM84_9HYPH|nr:phage head closure protein [Terrihabitans soli]BCJ90039.1 hypothetical protein IZ6_07740 [Terrihabitans soli]